QKNLTKRILAGVPLKVDDLPNVEDPERAIAWRPHSGRANLGFWESCCRMCCRQREAIMRKSFSGSITTLAIAGTTVGIVILSSLTEASAQAPATPTLTTPWGEPDLQGIWTDETDTPLQRSPKFANQEFFTEAQRAELDQQRANMLGRERRGERGT